MPCQGFPESDPPANHKGMFNTLEECQSCCAPCVATPLTHTFVGGGGAQRGCSPETKETATITVPCTIPLPFQADVSWSADDDIEVNGTRLNVNFNPGGGCPFGDHCCTSSGAGRMTFSSRNITVKLIDTVGISWNGTVTITPICPQ